MSEAIRELTASMEKLGDTAALLTAKWAGFAAKARQANAQGWAEAADRGDPFAQRVLAHAGHPRWNAEMKRRARNR